VADRYLSGGPDAPALPGVHGLLGTIPGWGDAPRIAGMTMTTRPKPAAGSWAEHAGLGPWADLLRPLHLAEVR
jgi:hypothetical protein